MSSYIYHIYYYDIIIKEVNKGWLPFFENNKEELTGILDKINDFAKEGDIIYPKQEDLFRSFFYHSPEDISLVILGQDCYISEENDLPQAMGLSFSVPKTHKKIPPSLKNIFKEIKNSYPEYSIPNNGFLERWADKEKILLLNSALTVLKGKSNSHANLWNSFTDKLIKWLQEINQGCIFILMGNFAQNKQKLINVEKHKIYKTVHPSPLSAHNGFFGCNVFKDVNDYLVSQNKKPIIW